MNLNSAQIGLDNLLCRYVQEIQVIAVEIINDLKRRLYYGTGICWFRP